MPVTSSTQPNPQHWNLFDEMVIQLADHTAVTLGSNVTLTPAQVYAGIYEADPGGAGRTVTLPTAADLFNHAPLQGLQVGSLIPLLVVNTADAAETITMAVGTGITSAVGNTLTVAQNARRMFWLRCTAVGSSPTFTLYNVS